MNELSTIDAPPELRESVSACVKWSIDNIIDTPLGLQDTGDHLKTIKARQKQADEFFDPPIRQAFDLHKMLLGRKKLITDPLGQSEKIDKDKMLGYQREQEEIARAEQRRLQAIVDEDTRKVREKAEEEAAKQRQIEADARAKAEAERRAAADATNAEERRRATAAAEAADRRSAAAAVKAEAKSGEAAAAVAPVIQVNTVAPVIKGIATVKRWKHEIVDHAALMDFICIGNRHDLIIVNEKIIKAYAESMTSRAVMPGVVFKEESIISSRSK